MGLVGAKTRGEGAWFEGGGSDARKLGLNKRHALTAKQFRLFVSGKGMGGMPAPARLVDESVRILTNPTGTPLYGNINGKVTPIVHRCGCFTGRPSALKSPMATRRRSSRASPSSSLATKMPARWTPIPSNVAQAIAPSSNGQVPYSQFQSSFPG